MNLIAIDGGYGYVKAQSRERKIVEPSLVAPALTIKYRNALAENGTGLTLELDGQAWFVGHLAQLQATDPISPRARERSAHVLRVLTLAALYRLGVTRGTTRLVTGLPVAWFEDKDDLRSSLTGFHQYAVNGERCAVEIAEVLVIPQPFGSYFRTLLSPDGALVDAQGLWQARVAVLDIGTYTSDYALADHLHYVESSSGSIPYAMSRVYELIQDHVAQRFGRELTFRAAEDAAQTGYITDRGEDIYVGDLLNGVLDGVAERVIGEAQTLWGDGRDLAAVLVTGGGGPVLMDHIRAVYPHARLVPNPQMANTEGFYRYGLRQFGA